MNFNKNILLDAYSDAAVKQFNDMQNCLSEIDNNFQTKMNGKTTGTIIGSIFGTIAWLFTFVVVAIVVREVVNPVMLVFASIIILGLLTFMLIDNIMDYSYYGKISSYKDIIGQLQNRVTIGKNAIPSNQDSFLSSKSKGWSFPLSIAPSISDEATSVETTMTSMETLKKGFINDAKNVFFFASVVIITLVGCISLFPTGSDIITGISKESFSEDTLMVFNIIALLITGVGEILLAKLVWSKTDCNVTNITLFIMLLSPVAFLALIALVTLIVMLVVLVASILLYIIVIVVSCAAVFASISGG